MARAEIRTIDEYLASQPEAARAVLARVRAAIRKALPGADEAITYKIPTYEISGRAVIYFAGWKAHYSLYPIDPAIAAACADELAAYELEKGTVRFSFAQRVPVRLIARLAKLRAERVAAKPASPRRSRAKR